MNLNAVLLPAALSRHCGRPPQHRPQRGVPLLRGGPQHPHAHRQQQQLQRDVGLHARPQGGADAGQQTGGVSGLPGWGAAFFIIIIFSSSFWTKYSEMYENPVEFFSRAIGVL